ncbi:uncharacterized protein C8Q71DRAFT_323995 [Rhodofomes roseus]|uniref:Uncharacterized protein n=1 Tax=Rhodofomes roseus TaxID=34475 RepID=A0ABQ8K3I2_9APHY|nr:uncharacterized protein C8Q71DRAFT_323995 [Rhodofomes roseus]KAH9830836.1 hypothetical protein C8Q71DRAFT_323995 [Rhodofomes roseus]
MHRRAARLAQPLVYASMPSAGGGASIVSVGTPPRLTHTRGHGHSLRCPLSSMRKNASGLGLDTGIMGWLDLRTIRRCTDRTARRARTSSSTHPQHIASATLAHTSLVQFDYIFSVYIIPAISLMLSLRPLHRLSPKPARRLASPSHTPLHTLARIHPSHTSSTSWCACRHAAANIWSPGMFSFVPLVPVVCSSVSFVCLSVCRGCYLTCRIGINIDGPARSYTSWSLELGIVFAV